MLPSVSCQGAVKSTRNPSTHFASLTPASVRSFSTSSTKASHFGDVSTLSTSAVPGPGFAAASVLARLAAGCTLMRSP
eukprot:m.101038 g.101038  ORF g.101038 m.101038 type:complete len:78 (+) comp15156_c0_seq2:1459-1692(+)